MDEGIRNRLTGLQDSGYLKITPDSEYEYEGFNNKLFIEKSAPFAMEEVLTVIEAIENKVREVLHQYGVQKQGVSVFLQRYGKDLL